MDTEELDSALNSNISRLVAALAVPIGGIVTAFLVWLQDKIGVNLQDHAAEITAFVGAMILGFALTAAKWLEGRKEYEKAATWYAHANQLGLQIPGMPAPPAPVPGTASDPAVAAIPSGEPPIGAEGGVITPVDDEAPPADPSPESMQGFE